MNVPSLLMSVAVLAAAGCSVLKPKPDPTRFYELTRLGDPPAAAQLGEGKTMVVTVRSAGYLQNNSVAERVAPNQIRYFPFDQWAQPFSEGVDQTLRNDLEIITGWAVLQANQSYVTRDAVRVDVQLNRFDVLPGHQVELAASWRVRTAQSGAVVHQDSFDQKRSYSPDPTSLQPAVAGLNELLHELSRAIVADLPK